MNYKRVKKELKAYKNKFNNLKPKKQNMNKK